MSTVATINTNAPINIANGFTSIVGDSMEAKHRVFNAISAAEELAEHLNKTIFLVDILAQPRTGENRTTGEAEDYTAITLIDSDNKAYRAGSKGLTNSIQDVVQVYGHPASWTSPLPIKVVEKKSPKGKFFSVELVLDATSK